MPERTAKLLIVFLLALLLVAANIASLSAVAQNQQSAASSIQPSDLAGKLAKIENEVEEKRKELAIPGVALAIVKDDKVIFQKGFGLRDVERNLPVTAETIFPIASSPAF